MLTWNDKIYKAFLLCYFDLVAEGVCSRHAVRRWWSDSGVVQLGTIFFTTWNFDSFLNFLKLAKSKVRSLRKKGPPARQPLVPYVGGGLWTQSKALSCPATQPIPHYFYFLEWPRGCFIERSRLLPRLPSRYINCTLKSFKKNICQTCYWLQLRLCCVFAALSKIAPQRFPRCSLIQWRRVPQFATLKPQSTSPFQFKSFGVEIR